MAPYYRGLASYTSPLVTAESDKTLFEKMEKVNGEEPKRPDERLQEAEKTEGEVEISEALKARATYLTRISDKACGLQRIAVFSCLG